MSMKKNLENIDPNNAVASIKTYLMDLQNRICAMIEKEAEDAVFQEDIWQHHEAGGGRTRIITGSRVIEKGGVNFSHVSGKALPQAATVRHPHMVNASFQALGVSVVMHPVNPYVPTSHFNIRFLVAEKPGEIPLWWFGGGFDLTPYYPFTEDCVHWHTQAKKACDPFGAEVYPRYKKAADDYFYLKHRQEARGIGGIFYDDLNEWGFDACFAFMRNVGEHYIAAYQPILQNRKHHPYGQREIDFQHYRRGRYVEYNLLYDRGTLFGLQFGGRIESILMSLPPKVSWVYNWQAQSHSLEAKLTQQFLIPQDWV